MFAASAAALSTNYQSERVMPFLLLTHVYQLLLSPFQANNCVLDAGGHVKVVDLGCARRIPSVKRSSDCSASNLSAPVPQQQEPQQHAFSYVGTLHCMAPEMVARRGHSEAVDWWALGILLAEMLAGRPPYPYGTGDDAADQEISAAIRDSTRETVSTRLEHLTATEHSPAMFAARDVIGALLEPEPRKRLGSAGASEVQSHACFNGWDWVAVRAHVLEPLPFCTSVGELEAAGLLEDDAAIDEADMQVFAGF